MFSLQGYKRLFNASTSNLKVFTFLSLKRLVKSMIKQLWRGTFLNIYFLYLYY